MRMHDLLRSSGPLLALSLFAACAQAPLAPTADAGKASVAAPSDEDRIAFFVQDARAGEPAAVQKDLATGVGINAIDTLGQTALIAAASHANIEVVRLLLDHGADATITDEAGWGPLHHAIYAGANPELLQLLLDHGARIDDRNDRGVTPLYLASSYGREDEVSFLIAHGADRALATDSGYTPLRIAQFKGYDRVVDLLEGRTPRQRIGETAADAKGKAAQAAAAAVAAPVRP